MELWLSLDLCQPKIKIKPSENHHISLLEQYLSEMNNIFLIVWPVTQSSYQLPQAWRWGLRPAFGKFSTLPLDHKFIWSIFWHVGLRTGHLQQTPPRRFPKRSCHSTFLSTPTLPLPFLYCCRWKLKKSTSRDALNRALKIQAPMPAHPSPVKCSHRNTMETRKLNKNCTIWQFVTSFFQGGWNPKLHRR